MKAPETTRLDSSELVIARASLFSGMSPEALTALMLACEQRRYAEGEWVVREGETGDSLFVVVRGGVEIVKGEGRAGSAVLDILKEAQFFGEMCLLGSVERSASVRACESTELVSLSHGVIRKLAVYYPDQQALLMWNLAVELSSRLRKRDLNFTSRAT